jgi:hypothetical protein
MKHTPLLLLFIALFLFNTYSCKEDDTFCIENLDISGTIPLVDGNIITIPGEGTYEGRGGKTDQTFTFGDYEMIGTTVNDTNSIIEVGDTNKFDVVYYWDDGEGNAFWAFGYETIYPKDHIGIEWPFTDEPIVGGGIGDFECATGNFSLIGTFYTLDGTSDFNITGEVCGGCD